VENYLVYPKTKIQMQEAKTFQAFLIASAFGKFKSVVSLTSVKNLTGELYDLTQKKNFLMFYLVV
jgi:hypothetical protein